MTLPAALSIVTTAARPDLVPIAVDWVWNAFWRPGGQPVEAVESWIAESVTAPDMPRTFVLLSGDTPVGTASLVDHDLAERPDLTPWLAAVFVAPAMRRRGYAAHLVAAVEAECRAKAIQTLWLYTSTAESVYARIHWHTVEIVEHRSQNTPATVKPVALMRRDLLGHASPGRLRQQGV